MAVWRVVMYSNLLEDALEFFGTTNDYGECGYITPTGLMIDMSGRHLKIGLISSTIRPSLRALNHGNFTGINHNGVWLTKKYPKLMTSELIPTKLFMQMTGCIRVSASRGIAEFTHTPTSSQVDVLYNMFYERTLFLGYSIGNKLIGDCEISCVTRRNLKDSINYLLSLL